MASGLGYVKKIVNGPGLLVFQGQLVKLDDGSLICMFALLVMGKSSVVRGDNDSGIGHQITTGMGGTVRC